MKKKFHDSDAQKWMKQQAKIMSKPSKQSDRIEESAQKAVHWQRHIKCHDMYDVLDNFFE